MPLFKLGPRLPVGIVKNPTMMLGTRVVSPIHVQYKYQVIQSLTQGKAVINKKVNQASIRSLYRTAAFIRTVTKRAQRKRRGKSPPPSPPYAHRKTGLRVIKFKVLDPYTAIIGPVKFPRSRFFDRPVPNIHEKGGIARSRRLFFGKKTFRYPERSIMYRPTKKVQNRLPAQARIRVI